MCSRAIRPVINAEPVGAEVDREDAVEIFEF
jgi:hypothetical protein